MNLDISRDYVLITHNVSFFLITTIKINKKATLESKKIKKKTFQIHLTKWKSPVAFKYFFLVNLQNVGYFPKHSVIGI